MSNIEQIRNAVASELEQRGLDNRKFLREIRAGGRDEGPYMIGALAAARLAEPSSKVD